MLADIAGTRIWYECAEPRAQAPARPTMVAEATGRSDVVATPVVVLHGWGANAASVRPIVTCLSAGRRVYALDFPGFGQSSLPPAPWGTQDYTDAFRQWLGQLGLTRVVLIGHSFGGRIAIRLAASHPTLVERMVLVDAAGVPPPRSARYMVSVGVAKAGKAFFSLPGLSGKRDKVRDALAAASGSPDYASAGPLRETFVRVVNEDLTPIMPQIKAPTLLIWGRRDETTPVSDGQLMERLIPDAGLVVLEQAGHFSYLDQPGQFCTIVRHFLEQSA